jgi:hypothetical protein
MEKQSLTSEVTLAAKSNADLRGGGLMETDGWKPHEGSLGSETSRVWSIRTICLEVGEPTMTMPQHPSGRWGGISAARPPGCSFGSQLGHRGHLATTFGRLQFAGAPMPYRVGSQWSSQRQEGRVFRFLPPGPSGPGSSARDLSGSRSGAVSGSSVHLRGHRAWMVATSPSGAARFDASRRGDGTSTEGI